ncbi:MAG: PorT family protein [Prevotella sp.]|nr:PorT family protein [Prevotella sp.]
MKRVIFMAVVMMISMVTFAQNKWRKASVKPLIGLNISDLTDANGDSRVGLSAGAEFEFPTTRMVSFTVGAIYSMQGNENAKFDYINFPVLANVYVAPGFAVKLGLQPGINVNDDNFDGVNSVDLSIPVGMSYEYNRFVFDARYNFGVTKAVDGFDSKNSVFMLTVGYKLPL